MLKEYCLQSGTWNGKRKRTTHREDEFVELYRPKSDFMAITHSNDLATKFEPSEVEIDG